MYCSYYLYDSLKYTVPGLLVVRIYPKSPTCIMMTLSRYYCLITAYLIREMLCLAGYIISWFLLIHLSLRYQYILYKTLEIIYIAHFN